MPSAWKVCTTGTSSERAASQRGQARHPEVRVHDVRRRDRPLRAQLRGEGGHVRRQLVLGHLARRPGVDVVDHHARRERDAPRQRRVVAARVDDDLVAHRAQRRGQRGHVRRSGRRRRRRRARRAGWRARRPWRSSSARHLLEHGVPVGQEALQPVALERGGAGGAAALGGLLGIAHDPRARRRPARRPGWRRRRRPAARPRAPRSCRAPRPACRDAWPRAATGRARSSGSGAGRRAGAPSPCGARPAAGPRSRPSAPASIPNRSSGAAAAKRSSRSVPVTRARRRASLMTTAPRGSSPL